MTKSTIIQIAAFVLLVAAGTVGVLFVRSYLRSYEKKVNTLKATVSKSINVDSIRNVIEKKIIDSVKVTLKDQDAKIDALTKDIKQTRRKNEAIEKRFNDIVISMPDF